MSKTSLTKEIERELFYHFFIKKSMRCGLEVACPKPIYHKDKVFYKWKGRCDFVAYDKDDIFTFIEIKISMSDFKSKNGHNLVGHKNYYAVPESIADKVRVILDSDDKYKGIGLYVWDGKKLYCVKRCKSVEPKFNKAKQHYGETQAELIKHNVITACNTRINNYLQGKIK